MSCTLKNALTSDIYSDALYPKKFCVSNPVLVSATGCQKYLSDICSLDVKLATSPPCAGSNSNFALKWLKSELVDLFTQIILFSSCFLKTL